LLKEEQDRYKELERHKEEVEKELHEAEVLNEAIVGDYGLKEATKYQRKLKADVKRRERELEKMSALLSEEKDTSCLLYMKLQKIKDDHPELKLKEYDEDLLREGIRVEQVQTKARMAELERQLNLAEEERVRLLRDLRDYASQISEKGIRFQGLDAEQLQLVNEYARNVREGLSHVMPLNDRSRELKAQVES